MASRSPISKLVNTEDREQAERELQQLVDAVPQHIVVLSGDGRRLYANQAARDYHSLTLDQFLVEPIINCFHLDDIENYSRIRDSGIASGEPWEAEARLRRKDGAYRWFLIRGKPLRNEQGLVVRWYLTRTDIEERKVAELELRQLIDAVPQYIRVDDKDGRVLYANDRLLDYFGMTLEEVQASDFRTRVCHPDDLDRVRSAREDAFSRGLAWEVEARIRRKDGKYRWFLNRYNPLRDEQGNIVRWYATGADIEDRKQAEWELRQIVDAVPQHIAVIAPDGRCIYGNQVALDFHGYNLEEFLDENIFKKKVHPDDLASYWNTRQRGISNGLPFQAEVRLRSKSGEYRWFLVLFNPLKGDQGQVLQWYATATDIEERRQAQRELQHLVDAVPQHIVVHAADGRRLYGNKVVMDYYGCTPEEFLDENTLQRRIHRDDLSRYSDVRQQGISAGVPFATEARLLSKSGQFRWFLILFTPSRDEQGGIVRWYSTGTDIEDRKQAENALRRSEAYLAEAQTLSHTGSFGWDVSSGEIYWSAETFRIFAFEPKTKVTIELIVQRTHPEDRPAVQQLIERVSRERTDFDVEHRLLMANGSVKYVHVVGHPSTDEWGRFEFVGAVTDITERKQAEAALLRSAEQLATEKAQLDELFELAPEGIVLLDVEDRVLQINPEFTRIFGYTPDEAIGRLINDLIAPEELRSEAEEYTQRIIHGKPVHAETIRRRKDGKRIHISLLAVPISVPGGGQIAEYAIYRDITERRHAEEALRRSESYLAEAQRLSHTGSWAWDFHRKEIIHWSPETFRVFGFDSRGDPVTWQEARSRIHAEDLQSFDENKHRVATEKIELEFDFRLVHPDGATKYAHCVSRPVINATGEVVELVGSIMDVTEQYQSRAALEKAFKEIKELKDELYRENLVLKDEIDQASMFEEIVGTSEVLRRVLVQVAKVAPTDSTVLISGETGTGKELIARAIHRRSQRSSRPFVSVNCGAIPAGLIGSELFGHEKGAFTGATQRRLGRFELADGGTLFLDEVGDLPAETQVALLRVLQERQFERVGGTQPIEVNVRIIAATNRDLKAAVAAGTFRSDLFYRLNVFPIAVPSLRDRKDDIPLLVEYLTERYASKAGKKIKNIHKRTLELFQAYDWPGNIRELQNVIERAVILCDRETFSVDDSWLESESARGNERGNGLARPGAEQEKKLIESALAQSRGRIAGPSGAAVKLGIPRSTLETKIRRLGIEKHRFRSG
jgi:PAS domain S-box-containing protein